MSVRKRLLFILLPLASLLFAEVTMPGGVVRRWFGSANDDAGAKIMEERQGEITRLFVTTSNCLDITITLTAQLKNMQGSFSHQAGSPNKYAHDWNLAEGSLVCAAATEWSLACDRIPIRAV